MNVKADKDSSIRWMNSLTNATYIVGGIISQPTTVAMGHDEAIKQMLEDYANFFFELEPKQTLLEKKIDEAKTINDLDEIKVDVIKSDSVSLANRWNDKKIALGA